ncbi:aminoglycoside phosphotransferase family protein [Pelomyxa schiedti]|nr:aminoglycoside phosphotransferase family protein [Pelomyxa schiedti]
MSKSPDVGLGGGDVPTVDDLAGDWWSPISEEHTSLPTITNFRGTVQAAWNVSGVQNFICAPVGISSPFGMMFLCGSDGRPQQFPKRGMKYRWKCYELERESCGVHTAVRMHPQKDAIIECITADRDIDVFLVFSGLARVWRFTDYWNLPPEDVPQYNVCLSPTGCFHMTDCKTFGCMDVYVEGSLSKIIYSELADFLAPGEECEHLLKQGRVGVSKISLPRGVPFYWYALMGVEEHHTPLTNPIADFESFKFLWQNVWSAAFTPGNAEFEGHLPKYSLFGAKIGVDLSRLYYMSILTLLMTRRRFPPQQPRALIATGGQAIWSEERKTIDYAYVWGGPEGAPTTIFLWEVEFQAPLLARLDPTALRNILERFMSESQLMHHWGIECISGKGVGMCYGVNRSALLSCVKRYVDITTDKQWALKHLDFLRTCAAQSSELSDYGDCQNILECVSTYEHKIAAFNAGAVGGLEFLYELTGETEYMERAKLLAANVLSLFRNGPFACLQPDGSERIVKTVLDFVYVGENMARFLPATIKQQMVAFLSSELLTPDWIFALAPSDPDALTHNLPAFQTYRADHQATGSYPGWPGRVSGILFAFGCKELAQQWLSRVQTLTQEGPFGQAHFIHNNTSTPLPSPDPTRHDAVFARKASFMNGNCNLESCGSAFATALLSNFL